MSNIDIIRAWKDKEYRNSLSEAEKAQLPENPAGSMQYLTDAEMSTLQGGSPVSATFTVMRTLNCPTHPKPTRSLISPISPLISPISPFALAIDIKPLYYSKYSASQTLLTEGF